MENQWNIPILNGWWPGVLPLSFHNTGCLKSGFLCWLMKESPINIRIKMKGSMIPQWIINQLSFINIHQLVSTIIPYVWWLNQLNPPTNHPTRRGSQPLLSSSPPFFDHGTEVRRCLSPSQAGTIPLQRLSGRGKKHGFCGEKWKYGN